MKRLLAVTVIFMLSVSLYAQKVTVDVPDVFDAQGQEGTLNDAVQAAIDAGTLSNTIFRLKQYGLYILSGTITTPPGETLEIEAPAPGNTQDTAPPMIAWTPSSAPDKRYSFDIAGVIKMKNVWLLYGSTDGTRTGSAIRVGDSLSVSGGRCEFENVLFDYAPISGNSSGCVEMFATHFKGKFSNCYFRNCGDDHFRYYGRALSFPYASTGLHADSVVFENCTFANIGYVYMQEGAEFGDNVFFNHCTFYNVVMYCLESGWYKDMSVTNSLFINTFMFGANEANDGADAGGGTIQITAVDSFGFAVPWTENDRHILFAHNCYHNQDWLLDWMETCPYSNDKRRNREADLIPYPRLMLGPDTKVFFDSTDAEGNKAYPFITRANNLDYMEVDGGYEPGFVEPPINLDGVKDFLNRKWDDNSDVNWMYNIEDGYSQVWPVAEDMSYANETLKAAGMGGYPLGDLYRWWPAEYAGWAAQKDAEAAAIETWRNTGGVTAVDGNEGAVVRNFRLSQNYPNPFNPSTEIAYAVPAAGHVSLKVYNNFGQEVATLVDGVRQAGSHTATFDGSGLASGVYYYRLESGDVTITKKCLFMK